MTFSGRNLFYSKWQNNNNPY